MVELYLNNQKVDLYGKETIATDYSIAPIGNIASRGSAKSITFKLPLTANNRAVIENANVIVNETVIPYRLVPAKLYANGLTQQIEFAQIKSIKDDISITLFGSNVDFFGILKGLKLSDLGDVWDHQWWLTTAHASRGNASGYIYAMIDFNADDFMSPYTATAIDVRGLLPSVFLHSIISEIISQAGYTAEGDFLLNADYRNIILPCGGIKSGLYGEGSLVKALSTVDQIDTDGVFGVVLAFPDIVNDPLNLFTGTEYTVIISGTFSLKVTFDWVGFFALGFALVYVDVNNTDTIGEFYIPSAGGTAVIDIVDVELQAGDIVRVHLFDPEQDTTILAGAEFEITAAPEDVVFGDQFDVAANLPDMKQSDLLKDTAQKFGLIFQVDNPRKIVHIRRFSEIIANIPRAKDWSDKVDYSEKPEIEFESEYGQRNLCEYKEDDTVIKPEGTDSEILIDNDNLAGEKKLFESPFAASEQVLRFSGVSISQIKIFTDLGTAGQSMDEVEPRYLIKRNHSFSVFTYRAGATVHSYGTITVPITHFILPEMDFNAGFENNLLSNSSDLIALIQQFKTVKMLMRITAADINQLDFFTPVWIELKGQPGCYFYISEIKQFKVTNNESTDVELVKLP